MTREERTPPGEAHQVSGSPSIDLVQPSQPRSEEEPREVPLCDVCRRPYPPKAKRGGRPKKYCSDACCRLAWERVHPGLRAMPPETRQRALPLDPPPDPLIPARDQRTLAARRRHFSEQAQTILTRLEEGPCSNAEMARMFPPATAWRSRLSDARWELRRRFGLRPKLDPDPIPHHDCGGGLVWYWKALC